MANEKEPFFWEDSKMTKVHCCQKKIDDIIIQYFIVKLDGSYVLSRQSFPKSLPQCKVWKQLEGGITLLSEAKRLAKKDFSHLKKGKKSIFEG